MAGTQTSPNTSNLNCTQMLKGWASEGWWPELVASATLHTVASPRLDPTTLHWSSNTRAPGQNGWHTNQPQHLQPRLPHILKGWASEGWWPELVASATLHTCGQPQAGSHNAAAGPATLMRWPEWLAHKPSPNTSNLNLHTNAEGLG
jgi:hypothetical protein